MGWLSAKEIRERRGGARGAQGRGGSSSEREEGVAQICSRLPYGRSWKAAGRGPQRPWLQAGRGSSGFRPLQETVRGAGGAGASRWRRRDGRDGPLARKAQPAVGGSSWRRAERRAPARVPAPPAVEPRVVTTAARGVGAVPPPARAERRVAAPVRPRPAASTTRWRAITAIEKRTRKGALAHPLKSEGGVQRGPAALPVKERAARRSRGRVGAVGARGGALRRWGGAVANRYGRSECVYASPLLTDVCWAPCLR